MKKILTVILATLFVAGALASCGRKGPLEAPVPKSQTQAAKAAAAQQQITVAPNDKPIILDGSGENVTPGLLEKANGNPFILDPLL